MTISLESVEVPFHQQMSRWLQHRSVVVAYATSHADASLSRWVPPTWEDAAAITRGDVQDCLDNLALSGKAQSSVRRFRASISSFFEWCIDHRLAEANPVSRTRVPATATPPREGNPFTRRELHDCLQVWNGMNPEAAALVSFLAATGLRWSEMRALRPENVKLGRLPVVRVVEAIPEITPSVNGVQAPKTTKTKRTRRVPIPEDQLPWLQTRMGEEWIAPIRWEGALRRCLNWSKTAHGHTVYDLRHTAITQWLTDGVDLNTVRVWAGHSDISTTNKYLHWLGEDADLAALKKVNAARAQQLPPSFQDGE